MEKESPERNKKRKLKTWSQVEALENCYKENKYPLELTKLKIAEDTGLTPKQVSGWFCHRRLKDKRLDKLTDTRQDHSSVVIQDRGSGFGQDSCGSSKHVDNYIDPREAESRRPHSSDFSSGDLNGGAENTSSDSCSSLQDRLVSREHPRDIETCRYLTRENVPYKPSGYLKVRGEIENSAITAVKKQLGTLYKADGPPLGVEFQQLPPGAFDSSVNCESYYVGNPAVPSSIDTSAVKNRNDFGHGHDRRSSMKSQDRFIEEAIPSDTFCGSESRNKNRYRLTGQNLPTDFYKESPLAALSYRKSNSTTSCSYSGEKTSNSVFNQQDKYSKNRQAKLMQSSREPYRSKVAEQARGEFMRQDFSTKAPIVERCGALVLRDAGEEEETTETSSSSG